MSTNPVAVAPGSAPASAPAPRGVPLWLTPLIGVAAGFVGLLPWLATGMRLPLQNLWGAATDSSAMPVVLLPFSQYYLMMLFALIATGSVAAGVAARALRPRLPRGGFWLVAGGVLLVQVLAIVQTTLVVRGGLQERTESTLYLAVLVAICILSVLIGFGLLVLIALAPRAGALIGLTIGAIAVGSWLSAWLHPFVITGGDVVMTLSWLLQWVPAILVGVAIAWTGLGSVGKAVAAMASLVILWIAPALITGVSAAAGTRVLAKYPSEMIAYAAEVFRMALFMPELALRPIVTAIVVAALGFAARALIRRTRTAT
ncbi:MULTISPECIES: hypothetical protein [Microbacterium]|uniref:hypothetical protein n=1 Tax=Microbacterium TaxID=33882 RepID=UPI000D65CE0F|nr:MULTISPECIES: hypothetical protein [Microbacterium]